MTEPAPVSPNDPTHPIGPMQSQPKNISDLPGFLLANDGYEVFEYHPLPNGQGKPTAVVIKINFGGALDGGSILWRVKSRAECNRLLTVLMRHRDNVWPKPE